MTQERWNDDRLDKLADDVADLVIATGSLLKVAESHQKQIGELSRDNKGLQTEVKRLVEEPIPLT